MPPGIEFEKHIESKLKVADVVLIVIGDQWLSILRERSQLPTRDYVLFEIEQSLSSKAVLIPLVINEARFPTADELPASIRKLADRQTFRLRDDAMFSEQVAKLTKHLKSLRRRTWRSWILLPVFVLSGLWAISVSDRGDQVSKSTEEGKSSTHAPKTTETKAVTNAPAKTELKPNAPASKVPIPTKDPLLGAAPGEIREFVVGLKMAWIPEGEFVSAVSAGLGKPVTIQLTKGFWMAQTETSIELWNRFSKMKMSSAESKLPVSYVSWEDICNPASSFMSSINLTAPKGWRFQLPTEAQWERASLAGSSTPPRDGSNGSVPVPVGNGTANAWALLHMTDNVSEWCRDNFGQSFSTQLLIDPLGSTSENGKVVRGAHFLMPPSQRSTTVRDRAFPNKGENTIGFRLVLEPSASRE